VLDTPGPYLPGGKLVFGQFFPWNPWILVDRLAKRVFALSNRGQKKTGRPSVERNGGYSQKSRSATRCKTRELYYEYLFMSIQIFAY
jgi:hypothetical protein